MKDKKENNKQEPFCVLLKKDLSILNKGDKLRLETKYLQIPMGDGMITLDVYESPEIFEILN